MEKYHEALLSLSVVEFELICPREGVGYAVLIRKHLGQFFVEIVQLTEAIRKKQQYTSLPEFKSVLSIPLDHSHSELGILIQNIEDAVLGNQIDVDMMIPKNFPHDRIIKLFQDSLISHVVTRNVGFCWVVQVQLLVFGIHYSVNHEKDKQHGFLNTYS